MKQILFLFILSLVVLGYSDSDEFVYRDKNATVNKRVEDLMERMTLEEKVAQTLFVWRMLGMEGLIPAES